VIKALCDSCGAVIADGISASEMRFQAQALYRRREGKDLWLACEGAAGSSATPCSAGCFGVRPAGTLAGPEVPARLRAFDIRGRIVAVTVCSPRRAARARATFVKRGHSNFSAACGGKVEGDAAFETPTAQ